MLISELKKKLLLLLSFTLWPNYLRYFIIQVVLNSGISNTRFWKPYMQSQMYINAENMNKEETTNELGQTLEIFLTFKETAFES